MSKNYSAEVLGRAGYQSMRADIASRMACGLLGKYNLKIPADQSTIAKLSVELADELIAQLARGDE